MERKEGRIVFMGTPAFAVQTLETLVEAGLNIVGVITSLDKTGGRGRKKLLESAVKKYAQSKEIPVLQPKNLKSDSFNDALQALRPDLIVVVAFRMLPEVVWALPKMGTVNLHASLLPAFRGAAPINWAIMRGATNTGATTFFIEKQIDTGKVLLQSTVPIHKTDNAGDLHDRLMVAGAQLMLQTVDSIFDGTSTAIAQDDAQATTAPKIFSADCKINAHQPSQSVYNFIRGLSPYPGAWTELGDLTLKIFRAQIIEKGDRLAPGTFSSDGKKYLHLGTFDHVLAIEELQLQGRKKMDVRGFLNGFDATKFPVTLIQHSS